MQRHPVLRRALSRPAIARFAAMLALAAVLFHGLMPLTQHVARQVQTANGIEQIVLCSALGLRTIAMKDGAPVDTDPAKTSKIGNLCPVCLSLAGHQPAILATAPALDLPVLAVTVLFGAASSSTLAQAPRHPQQARAPPASLS
ncbi:MAG: DUF2946 family protein [Ferrovibrio sp.]